MNVRDEDNIKKEKGRDEERKSKRGRNRRR